MLIPNAADAYGFGSKFKLPLHRADVTTCPCLDCRKIRGIQYAFTAHSEAIRFILHLRWWHWIIREQRKDWPKINRIDRRKR